MILANTSLRFEILALLPLPCWGLLGGVFDLVAVKLGSSIDHARRMVNGVVLAWRLRLSNELLKLGGESKSCRVSC